VHPRNLEVQTGIDGYPRGHDGKLSPECTSSSSSNAFISAKNSRKTLGLSIYSGLASTELVLSYGSLDEIKNKPDYTLIRMLGEGQTGSVHEVCLPVIGIAAQKCSQYTGRFLLNDYGALMDLQVWKHVPRVWGYYKTENAGDCYFMQVLGPSLRDVRQLTEGLWWHPWTIASIGLEMISRISEFEGRLILHGDAHAGNILLGRSAPGRLSDKLYYIDFDLSKRRYLEEDIYPEIRQLMYTLVYLSTGDEYFLQISDHKYCHSDYEKKCKEAKVLDELCVALSQACKLSFAGDPDEPPPYANEIDTYDFTPLRNLLRDMIPAKLREKYPEGIIWSSEVVEIYYNSKRLMEAALDHNIVDGH
jgi:tRNA A-37 threonylcarbamoyl transferase component Bud32